MIDDTWLKDIRDIVDEVKMLRSKDSLSREEQQRYGELRSGSLLFLPKALAEIERLRAEIKDLEVLRPALLDVLGAFQKGDVELLDTILHQNEMRIQEHRGFYIIGAEHRCLRRLAAAAAKMEARDESN